MVLFYGLKVNKFSFSPLFKLIYEYIRSAVCVTSKRKNSKGVVASGVIYILMEETWAHIKVVNNSPLFGDLNILISFKNFHLNDDIFTRGSESPPEAGKYLADFLIVANN